MHSLNKLGVITQVLIIVQPLHPPAGLLLVVAEDLLAEFEDELVEAEVDLRLDLVVEKLLAKVRERVVRRVVVQVQGVQHAPEKKKTLLERVFLNIF